MFQGSFLTSTRVLSDDDCPEYLVECFIFEKKYFSPISNHPSFVCKYSLKVELNSNQSNATAWCYGWIIRFQTTKSILDQLGISIAFDRFFYNNVSNHCLEFLNQQKFALNELISILYLFCLEIKYFQ